MEMASEKHCGSVCGAWRVGWGGRNLGLSFGDGGGGVFGRVLNRRSRSREYVRDCDGNGGNGEAVLFRGWRDRRILDRRRICL